MFDKMSSGQLAGWGYGFFWSGLLFETINAFVSAHDDAPLRSPWFYVGAVLAFVCVALGLRMMLLGARKL